MHDFFQFGYLFAIGGGIVGSVWSSMKDHDTPISGLFEALISAVAAAAVVDVLPKEKKYAVLREATEEVKTEQAEEAAERGIWESIKEFASELGEAALEIAKTVVYESSPKLLKRLWDWLF